MISTHKYTYKENESATETYQHFIDANQQVAETCLKQVKKARREEQSLNPKVTVARKKTFIADKGEDGKSREEYAKDKGKLVQNICNSGSGKNA